MKKKNIYTIAKKCFAGDGVSGSRQKCPQVRKRKVEESYKRSYRPNASNIRTTHKNHWYSYSDMMNPFITVCNGRM